MSPLALLCIARLPVSDVTAVVEQPSPHAIIRLAADVAGCVPQAWPLALALGMLAAGKSSTDPILDAQTSLARGGQRR